MEENPLRPSAEIPPGMENLSSDEIVELVDSYFDPNRESRQALQLETAPVSFGSGTALGSDVGTWELGSGRGGGKAMKAVLWEVIRPLKSPDDLPLLSNPVPAPRQTLTQIRHSHHQLARLISQGTEQAECSLITGYAPAYISVLKGDPSFNELIAYYAGQQEQVFVDVIERMRSLGLSTLEELQSRLELEPTSYSHRELMELAELTLVKPMAATRSRMLPGGPDASPGGGVSVQVNFVKSESIVPIPSADPRARITIDATAYEEP